jgi:hypothetical protein
MNENFEIQFIKYILLLLKKITLTYHICPLVQFTLGVIIINTVYVRKAFNF